MVKHSRKPAAKNNAKTCELSPVNSPTNSPMGSPTTASTRSPTGSPFFGSIGSPAGSPKGSPNIGHKKFPNDFLFVEFLDDDDQGVLDSNIECLEMREFPQGKFGMDIEKTAICKVCEPPSNAADLGVKVGWVIYAVNDKLVKDKKAIIKEASAAVKSGPVKFAFRAPLLNGYLHCTECNKFLAADQFDATQIAAGPGKQQCIPCYEVAGCDIDL